MKRVKLILVQVFITLLVCEMIFRLFGYQPYKVEKYSLTSEPAGYMLPDETLGFRLGEGTFDVTINDSVKYQATHDEFGKRITYHFIPSKNDTPKIDLISGWDGFSYNEISLFGGSFPYGMGVEDTAAYPFLLKKGRNNIYVTSSYCVPGYGMVQSLLQLDSLLEQKFKLKYLVLHYASFYDDRNALTPEYRVALHHGFMNSSAEARQLYSKGKYPYFKKVNENDFEIDWQRLDQMYRNWWLREYSAGINFLQTSLDKLHPSFAYENEVSKAVIEQMQIKCKENGIELIIATITNDKATDEIKSFCKKNQINLVDLFVDYTNPEYSNLPYDSHPNAKAHQLYADKMLQYLSTLNE